MSKKPKPKLTGITVTLLDEELDILEQVHSAYCERDPHLHISRSAVIRSILIPAFEAFLKTQKRK